MKRDYRLRHSMHRKLIRHLLAHPDVLSLSVDDGGDFPAVEETRNRSKIVEAVESVDDATIVVHMMHGGRGWAQIIPYAVDADETVVDFSAGGIIDEWFEAGQR